MILLLLLLLLFVVIVVKVLLIKTYDASDESIDDADEER